MRKELGLDPRLPAVLLMGGGEGMGPVEETARALGEELYDHRRRRRVGQVVVICGRNQALRSTLQSLRWKVPVKVGTMHVVHENEYAVSKHDAMFRCAFQMDGYLCIFTRFGWNWNCWLWLPDVLSSFCLHSSDQRVRNTDGEVDGRLRLHHHKGLSFAYDASSYLI